MSITDTGRDHLVADPARLTSRKLEPMVWIWLALLSLVVGWLGITPIYSPPRWSAVLFFAMAVAFLCASFRHTHIPPLPKTYLSLLFPLGFSIILIPWPYSLGSLLLAASLVTMRVGERSLWLRRGAVALGVSGLAMLIHAASQPALWRFFALHHGAAWAAEMVRLILKCVGACVSVSGSVLYYQTYDALMPINITWEALGFYPVASLTIVGVALLLIFRVKGLHWMAFFLALVVYPFIRYTILLLAYEEGGRQDLFWSPWVAILTFAPLAVFLGRSVTGDLQLPEHVRWPQLGLGSPAVRVLLASGVAAMCAIGLFSFDDPGTTKRGRVLIDEAHSDWERTTRKYDTKWYNEASGYNYYCLADYLDHFYRVSRGNAKITSRLLDDYDILILKTLTKPLEQEEIDAIVDFVRDGGGLWLIGDHTNVFGISAHTNPLAKRFGMSYKYDATYDLTSGRLTTYRPPTMLPHPSVQHMPPVFLFGTSCTMVASIWADYPIIGYGLRSLRADYARDNFFPENKLTLDQEFGLFPQQVAVEFGRGRVVAFTDSTVFSNFWFYMPGKSELCLGTVNWLNHSNKWGVVRWLLGIIAVCALRMGIRWSRRSTPAVTMVWVLAGILLAVPMGIRAFAAMNRAVYALPTPRRSLPRIAFEREHCNFTLPSEAWDASIALDNNYHTFFAWTQRLGYMPASIPSLDTSLTNAKVLVLVNPNKNFSAQELLRINRYLQAGGRVLVLDGAHNKDSAANQMLEDYGIKIEGTSFPQSWVFDRKGRKIAGAELPRPVTGGEPVLMMALDKSFLTATKVGKGLIAVIGSSHLFTDRSMGSTSTVPNAHQSGIYEMEFWLFRNLMEGPPDPKLWDSPRPM